jgi:hypothetical protein
MTHIEGEVMAMPIKIMKKYEAINGKTFLGQPIWQDTKECSGVSWFVTNEDFCFTEYARKEDAGKVIDQSKKRWPDIEFKIVET